MGTQESLHDGGYAAEDSLSQFGPHLTVLRYSKGVESTLGLLFWKGDFMCFTLEDEVREIKVAGETAIPLGKFKISLRTWGGFHERYAGSSWISDLHEGMLQVGDVPGFTDILLHCGNTDKDTAGCLLLGDSAVQNVTEFGSVGSSRNAYRRVYPVVLEALKAGEDVTIVYRDADA
tara:strand:- start:3263 stop:3790 length:528 start_codon:yes stop_codon:yes gene_type:complete